jgi:hypothetical protein
METAKCGRLYGESADGAGGCGKKPHGPGKKGTKRSLAFESHGVPIGVTLSGANVCLDAAYTGTQKLAEGMGYKAHIRPRGEENQEKKKNP